MISDKIINLVRLTQGDYFTQIDAIDAIKDLGGYLQNGVWVLEFSKTVAVNLYMYKTEDGKYWKVDVKD
jgi:hypothetical protein